MRLARIAAALWGAIIVATLAIGALAPASSGALASGGPACPLRAATGIPCPFCGMTHATLALGHGDLGAALASHPLAPLVVGGMLAAMLAIALGHTRWLTARRVLVVIGLVWAVRLMTSRS